MELSVNKKSIVLRFVRVLVLTVLGLVAAWAASPDALALVGKEYAVLVTALVVPALAAADKYLRAKWGIKKVLAARAAAANRAAGTPNVVHVHRVVETGETSPATPAEVEAGVVTRTLGH